MAEGILQHLIAQEGLEDKISVESAGTSGYHIGRLPDERMRAVAEKHGITLTSKARQLSFGDFYDFDYIIAMDRSNLSDIMAESPLNNDHKAQIILMREFDMESTENDIDVPDPYYGGNQGFENVYKMLYRSSVVFLNHVKLKVEERESL